MHSVKIEQRLGCWIEEITEKRDISKAGELLSTRKQKKYTYALRDEDQATLVRHVWHCPHCGERTPAYAEYFQEGLGRHESVSKSKIADWATLQLSLFGIPKTPVYLNSPLGNAARCCPHCGKESKPSNRKWTVTYRQDKHHLTISTEITDISALFSLKWMSSSWMSITFPLYETVVFNFRKGTTYLKLHDANGTIYTVSDITQKPEAWCNGPLYDAFTTNRVNQRMLKRTFLEHFGGTLPFCNQELTPNKYVLLTRFIGYSRSFYNAIPFTENTGRIDGSFKSVAKKLHRAESLPALYEEYMLPKAKSIRKIFFENPGLFFYKTECQKLWILVQDINLYRRLLQSNANYDILSQLHLYPGVLDYYHDYIAVKGVKSLINNLEKRLSDTNFEAVTYSAMSKQSKRVEQERWKNGKVRKRAPAPDEYDEEEDYLVAELPQPVRYSIPMHAVGKEIIPCVIDGYYFNWLYSMNDYISAGHDLKNCLKRWERWQHPVVAIFKDNEIVGAIEVNVERQCVVQAHTKRNGDIKLDESLNNAFKKWRRRYNLKCFECF